MLRNARICVLGLGYVGLPLAIEFSKKYQTVGFDINKKRIQELKNNIDHTYEYTTDDLKKSNFLTYTHSLEDIKACEIYIVTVPTPIDSYKNPDLTALIKASEIIGQVITKGNFVIFESTVYPGATEDDCVPIIEAYSKLRLNQDFFVGYSPERINPGDKKNKLTTIKKITSGSCVEATNFIDQLYKSIIPAGTYKVSSIKVAEAAKIIENTQRDLNIALINELAVIFNKLNINTEEVLNAAETKWNFIPFKPGLVGGHCIGVDPYYLTYKAKSIGYQPEVILAGRRINDQMSHYITSQLIKVMIKKKIQIVNSDVLIMGVTFKENCSDLRNSKVLDIIKDLNEYEMNVTIHDPLVNIDNAYQDYGINVLNSIPKNKFSAIIFAVAHDEFKKLSRKEIISMTHTNSVICDIKYILDPEIVDIRL